MTDPEHSTRLGKPKAVGDTDSQDIRFDVLSRSWGMMMNEKDPGHTVRQHRPGSNLTSTAKSIVEAQMKIPELPPALPPEEAKRYIVGVLDELRKQGEEYRKNKPRWMVFAEQCGLSYAEIAVVLKMSEGATRRAINRAKKKAREAVGGA